MVMVKIRANKQLTEMKRVEMREMRKWIWVSDGLCEIMGLLLHSSDDDLPALLGILDSWLQTVSVGVLG